MNYIIDEHNRICGTTEINDTSDFPDYMQKRCRILKPEELFKDCKDEKDRIERMLSTAQIYYEFWFEEDRFYVEVIWGDWKHDHLMLDDLMASIGYKGDEEITEEDGSDCYSAIHRYEKIPTIKVQKRTGREKARIVIRRQGG